jgi:hypothetical protein
VERVRFTGGEHSGLVVEAPPDIAERLPLMRFAVMAGGQLFDLVEQCRIPGTRVVARPGDAPEAPLPTTPGPVRRKTGDRGSVGTAMAISVPAAGPAVVAAPVGRGVRPAAPDEEDGAAAPRPRRVPPGAPVFRSARPAR